MSRNVTIIAPSQEEIQRYVRTFLRYISEVHDYLDKAHRDSIEGYYSEPLAPPPSFLITIDGVSYQAQIVDVTSRKKYAAGLAVCSTESGNMFFCFEKDVDSHWSARQTVLDMEWKKFIELSKAEQFAALNC